MTFGLPSWYTLPARSTAHRALTSHASDFQLDDPKWSSLGEPRGGAGRVYKKLGGSADQTANAAKPRGYDNHALPEYVCGHSQ